MKAVNVWGIDYGTTTSLWIEYKDGKFIRKCNLSSSIYVGDTGLYFGNDAYCCQNSSKGRYIRSPKLFLEEGFPSDWGFDKTVEELLVYYFKDVLRKGLYGLKSQEDSPYLTLTVPNSFKSLQYVSMRKSLITAAREIFNVKFNEDNFDIIPEPVAAALYYIHSKITKSGVKSNPKLEDRYIVVCDIGGGTTDMAVVKCAKNYNEDRLLELSFKVLCTTPSGNGLGGDVFDRLLVDYFEKNGKIPLECPQHIVYYLAKTLKAYLSDGDYASVPLVDSKWNIVKNNMSKPIMLTCSRDKFENIIDPYVERLVGLMEGLATELKQKIGFDPQDLILLPVGGSSRIPKIKKRFVEIFEERFPETEVILAEADETIIYDSVACGAAIYSAWRAQNEALPYAKLYIENKTPHRYSIKDGFNRLYECVPRNAVDGVYSVDLRPIELNVDNATFTIGRLIIYQGEGDILDSERNVKLHDKYICETLYTHNKAVDQISIKVEIIIKSSRADYIKIIVKEGCKDRSDFVKIVYPENYEKL